MLLSADDRLSRARIVLERRGVAASDLLSPAISESWGRCLAAGLDPARPPPPAMADAAALLAARERSDLVRRLALAEMETLYQQISGTNFMVAFAAADGMLLDTFADPSFSATAHAAAIRPGALWAETRCGTNALGTTAAAGRAVMVHGGEHFFQRFGELTCTAAPIFDADGALCGVLDASSDCRSRQRHTGALVGMAATQIENGLLREQHRGSLLLAFHSRAEFLHTLNVGLLAFDLGGTVVAANAQARFLLQGLPAARGRRFSELFRGMFTQVLDGSAERLRLEDRVGSIYAARLETPPRAPAIAVGLPKPPPPAFVAEDDAVALAVRQAEAAAARRLPVLIRGETGTGKEQLARHVHAAAKRAGAFIPVNCAALPETLAEAELFGHAEGAFTGARRGGAKGLVLEADGGTLFLDEIGDMKLALQAVLLRLLDDWTVRPVGGGRARAVDVQLVAASNVDLPAAVAAGRFRADLFWRLNTVEVLLPPLRDRTDIAAIARHVLAGVAPHWRITDDAVEMLQRGPWPGNVRELRSVLTRLTLMGAGGAGRIDAATLAATPLAGPLPPAGLHAQQRARIASVYRECGSNVSAAARKLGVSRNTIYRALASGSELRDT
jgi:transcriptional regulator of acetoin/glycerol metabolism